MEKYIFIRLWGEMMRSNEYYILNEMARAEAEGAPERAIYKSYGSPDHKPGEWVTIDEVKNVALKDELIAIAERREGGE